MNNKKPSKQDQIFQDALALHQSGQLDLAEVQYRKLLSSLPNNTLLLNNLAGIAFQRGDLEEGIKIINQSLSFVPNQPDALNNRGNAFRELKQFDKALTSYDRAIAIKPDHVYAHCNRGNVLRDLKRLNDALASYNYAIALNPDYVDAHYNRGNVLRDLKKMDEALASYNYAVMLKPNYVDAHYNCGNLLKELKRFDEAVISYDRAIALKVNHVDAHHNRGGALKELRRFEEALKSYESVIDLNPNIDFILGDSFITRMQLCIWDNFKQILDDLISKVKNDEKVLAPFIMLSLMDNPEIQRKVAEIFVKETYALSNTLPPLMPHQKHRKIRIAYFSSDFRNHPVSFLTAGLYEAHNRDKFEIYAFSISPIAEDEMTARIKAGVDHFYNVNNVYDKDVAMLARSLEIDIAVDLGGYTQYARIPIFAIRVAPIQISYIGYLGTMAASYFDYIIADKTIIPEENQKYYSEKIIYLPSYQVNDSKTSLPSNVTTKKELGLPETGFIFCCFNNNCKIIPRVFDSWARILEKVENSVLFIYAENETIKSNLKKEITLRGLDSNRLVFGERVSVQEYLARYLVADLFLDTLPYNAGTTASDALRMGLPVLTLMGQSFAARMAASLLNNLNLPELITNTEEEYEKKAIELATNPEKIKAIKDKLRDNLTTSSLYNTELFARNIEAAYEVVYDRSQRGLELNHVYVE